MDDPLLERAERDGDDWRELALRETDRYRGDMEALRILPPTHHIGAVEAIGVIDPFAERLAARGSLYDLDGDAYFARCADQTFGALSGRDGASGLSLAQMAALSAERGGDPDRPGKKDALDPLVWRADRPGEPVLGVPLRPGRPGWHVECAAIATEYLGAAFDVQAGGTDLVFPHHEMSASHARVAARRRRRLRPGLRALRHGRPTRAQKMSKSLGNLVFVSGLRDGAATRWRSGWPSWPTTTGRTGSGPTGARGGHRPARPLAGSGAHRRRGGLSGAGWRGRAGRGPPRLADDLDAPGALAVVDHWAAAVLAGPAPPTRRPPPRWSATP